MPAIGNRPWVKYTSNLFKKYAHNNNVDFILCSSYPSEGEYPFPDLPDTPGRPNKKAYALKPFLAYHYLKNYDKVAIVDDTCCIRPSAPNLFDQIPENTLGAKRTGAEHWFISCSTIATHTLLRKCPILHSSRFSKNIIRFGDRMGKLSYLSMKKAKIPLPTGKKYKREWYGNGGVRIYPKSFRNAFSPEQIQQHSTLLFSNYPEQTLVYFLQIQNKIPFKSLPGTFNNKPGDNLPPHERVQLKTFHDMPNDESFVYHVTGAYKFRQELIASICEELERS